MGSYVCPGKERLGLHSEYACRESVDGSCGEVYFGT